MGKIEDILNNIKNTFFAKPQECDLDILMDQVGITGATATELREIADENHTAIPLNDRYNENKKSIKKFKNNKEEIELNIEVEEPQTQPRQKGGRERE